MKSTNGCPQKGKMHFEMHVLSMESKWSVILLQTLPLNTFNYVVVGSDCEE